MSKLPSLFPARGALNQYSERRVQLQRRIQTTRETMLHLIRLHLEDDPNLAARLHSLLLFAEGLRLHDIAQVTGLTPNTILRVRRRYECWGLNCVK